MNIKRGDVVFLKQDAFIKNRKANGHPAVVISVSGERARIAVCTSSDRPSGKKKDRAYELPWADCGLKKPTMALCYKIGSISVDKISSVCGHLSSKDYNELVDKLRDYGGFKRIIESENVLNDIEMKQFDSWINELSERN